MRHLFVINPVAGKYDRSVEIIQKIKARMESAGFEYECAVTKAPMDAAQIVHRAARTGEELRVYACGGDGTLNEAVNGAAGFKNAAVTHLPIGSGNDFIKMFGDDARRFSDLDELLDCESSELDLIDSNGRLCLNICSAGLDARIGTDINRFKRLAFVSGGGAYLLSTLYHVIKGVHQEFLVSIDGRRFDGRFTMIVAANGRFYGGGFHAVPDAEPDDGKIDFILVKAVSRLQVAGMINDYKAGKYAKYPEIFTHVMGADMELEHPAADMSINIDGELIRTRKLSLRLSDKKVRIFYPRGSHWEPSLRGLPGRAEAVAGR